jgi:hypothetical protein
MTDPIEDQDSPLYFAARAHTDDACAFWCARAIARHTTKNFDGSMRELVYNRRVKQLRVELLALIKRTCHEAA